MKQEEIAWGVADKDGPPATDECPPPIKSVPSKRDRFFHLVPAGVHLDPCAAIVLDSEVDVVIHSPLGLQGSPAAEKAALRLATRNTYRGYMRHFEENRGELRPCCRRARCVLNIYGLDIEEHIAYMENHINFLSNEKAHMY